MSRPAALTLNYFASGAPGETAVQVLEVSGEYVFSDSFIVGPGILVGLDNQGVTPGYGVGVLLTRTL